MSHFDSVTELGPEFREVGYTTMGDGGLLIPMQQSPRIPFGDMVFSIHPEVGDTEYGQEMIANFARNICECAPTWSMDAVVEEQIAAIQKRVGEQSVFLLASGGVDSTVAAKLIAMALPEGRLKLLHVDNGMMRKGESAAVMELLASLGMGDNAHFVDASEDFLEALAERSNRRRNGTVSARRSWMFLSGRPADSGSKITCWARGRFIRTRWKPEEPNERIRSKPTTTGYQLSSK